MEGTGLDNATRLYRIRRTCNEMLADRGYVIGTVSNIFMRGMCCIVLVAAHGVLPCPLLIPHCRCLRGVCAYVQTLAAYLGMSILS